MKKWALGELGAHILEDYGFFDVFMVFHFFRFQIWNLSSFGALGVETWDPSRTVGEIFISGAQERRGTFFYRQGAGARARPAALPGGEPGDTSFSQEAYFTVRI